jgi:phosphoribosyl-dephospho-CoA transferase
LRAIAWPDTAAACLAHWASHDLPLVVTRQRALEGEARVSLGLPAPQRWQRQRLALQVDPTHIATVGAFPVAEQIHPYLGPPEHAPWRALGVHLVALGVAARVHGSFGWQVLTGLDHVHPASDLDLLLPVHDPDQADEVVQALQRAPWPGPRLDGELIFHDGSAVAWREWPIWRAGLSDQLLVKRRDEAVLESGQAWLQRATAHVP